MTGGQYAFRGGGVSSGMETWRLLAWTTGLLVLWAALVSVLGYDISPWSILFAALFGMFGFYLSTKLVERWAPDDEE